MPSTQSSAESPAPGRAAPPVLDIRDLRVEIPTRRRILVAVDGVSLQVAPGEVLGLVGESGAGKSLTGSAVIGLLEPPGRIAAGEIRLEGRRIDGLSHAEMRRLRGRRIGAVFQDPLTSLNPLFTVGDQLAETMRAHLELSPGEAWRRAAAWLDEVGIHPGAVRAHHHPHQFSGGMRQRIVLALALCAEPRLLVADEPTTALDVSLQAQVVALLRRLCRERGVAVLLITHDMGVVAEICDRVAVMYAGRIVETGPTAQVLRTPLHPYARELLACVPSLAPQPGRLRQIDGAMPRLGEVPAGCAFHPRCPDAMERCRRERPEARPEGERLVACWLLAGPPQGGTP
ncbi:MAG TPA: ABC transporter ATP-binding protein [Anaeromyxobacteraceae bacterium]|nr:ABC transporter ATP-binding protein [Anaeromyxobacteraceae bacterium]